MCHNAPPGNLVIIGRTNDTIKRNIIDEILNFPNIRAYYYSGKRELHMEGRIIYCIGANDDRSESKIRGPTFSGAYVDEATLIPESFFKMLISRLSRDGSKLLATTNPDSPFHWFKKDFLDRPELDIKIFNFRMEDNPSLSSNYIDALKKEYRGLWYRRFIDGEWCLAEGSVYDFFDEGIHVIDHPPTYAKYYICSVDYGTTNPCVFLLLGFNDDAPYGKIWVQKEYYFDSRKEGRQKTDAEYADDFFNFISDYPVRCMYIDPSAASFKLELKRRSQHLVIKEAINDVLDGIRVVSLHLATGDLKICKECRNLIQEFQSYTWDSKAAERGEDKPLKAFDHCFGKGTLIETNFGPKPIESIQKGDLVLTRHGFKRVLKTWSHLDECYEWEILGKKIECTDSHQFYTYKNGWKKCKDLIQSDMLCINPGSFLWQEANVNFLKGKPIEDTLIPNVDLNDFILLEQEKMGSAITSIEMYGNLALESYHPNTIFITKTETLPTMMLGISNWFQLKSISPPAMIFLLSVVEKDLATWHIKKQQNGINRKKGENGTLNTGKIHGNRLKNPINAHNAISFLNPQNDRELNFVKILVKVNGAEIISLIMRVETAEDVAENSGSTNTVKSIFVAEVAPKNLGKKKVYDLTVEDAHEYFAEGILVHNCLDALRYALATHWGHKKDLKEMSQEQREFERWKEMQMKNSPWAPSPASRHHPTKFLKPR